MSWLALALLAQGANMPPTASFTATPTSGPPTLTVNVNASASSDPDGTIVSYSWDWEDDGTPDATGPSTSRAYTATGTYRIRLTVTDNLGATGTATALVDVSAGPPPGYAPPVPIIQPWAPIGALTIAFSAISHDSDVDPFTHRWDFGDGSAFVSFPGLPDHSTTTPMHTYPAPGAYVLVFRSTSGEGLWREATQVVNVYAPSAGGSSGSGCGATGGGAALWLAVLAALRRRRR